MYGGQDRVWKFENGTTGMSLECNDLGFLLTQIRDMEGIEVTNESMSDLILRGKTERVLSDDEGNQHRVKISEHPELKLRLA